MVGGSTGPTVQTSIARGWGLKMCGWVVILQCSLSLVSLLSLSESVITFLSDLWCAACVCVCGRVRQRRIPYDLVDFYVLLCQVVGRSIPPPLSPSPPLLLILFPLVSYSPLGRYQADLGLVGGGLANARAFYEQAIHMDPSQGAVSTNYCH